MKLLLPEVGDKVVNSRGLIYEIIGFDEKCNLPAILYKYGSFDLTKTFYRLIENKSISLVKKS